jgi:hypothetical protein
MKGEYTNIMFWTVSLLTPSKGKGERSTVCKVTKKVAIIRHLDLNAIRRPRRGLRQDTETGSFVIDAVVYRYVLKALHLHVHIHVYYSSSQLTTHSQYKHDHLRSILISCIPWPMSLTLDISPSSPSPIPCGPCRI